jgi:hypothetical protein
MAAARKPLKVRSNGALRKAAGVHKSGPRKGKLKLANVRKLANGKGKTAQRARFYLNVLHRK